MHTTVTETRFPSWPYIVTTPPAAEPVTKDEAKNWLRIEVAETTDDALITSLIIAARITAEKQMRRDLINRSYDTFRNGFSDGVEHVDGGEEPIILRRAPLLTATAVAISYLVDGTPTALVEDTDFRTNNSFPHPNLTPITTWPDDADDRQNVVTITFDTGFGAASTDIPEDIRTGILEHISSLYENRGDSEKTDPSVLPAASILIYGANRIVSI